MSKVFVCMYLYISCQYTQSTVHCHKLPKLNSLKNCKPTLFFFFFYFLSLVDTFTLNCYFKSQTPQYLPSSNASQMPQKKKRQFKMKLKKKFEANPMYQLEKNG